MFDVIPVVNAGVGALGMHLVTMFKAEGIELDPSKCRAVAIKLLTDFNIYFKTISPRDVKKG